MSKRELVRKVLGNIKTTSKLAKRKRSFPKIDVAKVVLRAKKEDLATKPWDYLFEL